MNLQAGLGDILCPLTISQALIFSTCTLSGRVLTFPQAGECVACFLVHQASLGPLPLSGPPEAANRYWVCPAPAAIPVGVEAENSQPMGISWKPGRETSPGLSNNCADCANTILVQEPLYSPCHLEGQKFYLGESSGMPPMSF